MATTDANIARGTLNGAVPANWNQLEQAQMKATARLEARIRQEEGNLRKAYRDELELQLRLKSGHKENKRVSQPPDASANKSGVSGPKVEMLLKQMEKKRMNESLMEAERRRRETHERALRERSQAQEEIERNMSLQQQEGYMRQRARAHEAQMCRSYYEMAMERKRERARAENTLDRDFFRQEKEMLEKMARENRELVEKIRMSQARSGFVTDRFAEMDCQKKMTQASVDRYFVDQGRVQKDAEAANRDRYAQERSKAQRQQMGEVLQAQIDGARQSKELQMLEELKRDHENVSRNVSKVQMEDAMRAQEKRAMEATTSQMLAIQVADKMRRERQTHLLSATEKVLNGVDKGECGQQSSHNIPGFCVQPDRKKMIRMISQDARHTETILKLAMEHPQNPEVVRHDRSDMIKRAVGSSEECPPRLRGRFASEYDFLRLRNWTKDYNIISNQPLAF